jgi:hypothetical protein
MGLTTMAEAFTQIGETQYRKGHFGLLIAGSVSCTCSTQESRQMITMP